MGSTCDRIANALDNLKDVQLTPIAAQAAPGRTEVDFSPRVGYNPNARARMADLVNVASPLGLSHPDGISAPPADDPIDTIAECAGRCAYPHMCGPDDPTQDFFPAAAGFGANKLPAPRCLVDHAMTALLEAERATSAGEAVEVKRRVAVANDPYYKHPQAKLDLRYAKTRDLIEWGATRAAISGGRGASCLAPARALDLKKMGGGKGLRGFHDPHPMSWPEEFEFKTKTLLLREPHTYLEWGSGGSTGFYPLVVTGSTDVIDNYPPWCEKVSKMPIVSCMIREKRLNYSCTPVETTKPLGHQGVAANAEDNELVKAAYLQAVVDLGTPHYDAALIDGRYRVSCALQLLLTRKVDETSVVIIHDFWNRVVRPENYTMVLKYYNVLGGARSVAAFRPKPGRVDYAVIAQDIAAQSGRHF